MMASHDNSLSLWAHTAQSIQPNSHLDGDHNCDVLIIGAGFTGMSCAMRLAEAGTKVTIVDIGDVGYGASGRNGGQINPMMPFNGPSELRSKLGPIFSERLIEASMNSADSLFRRIKKYDVECGARQNGWLRVDHCKKARKTARQAAKGWNDLGAGIEFVDGDDVHQLCGSPIYQSGTLHPKGGAVQPLSLVRGFSVAAKKMGVSIFGQTKIDQLVQTSKGWTARAEHGSVNAQWVVLATNGYTGNLYPNLRESLIPVSPIQMATDKLDDDIIDSILPGGQTISDTRRIIMYARREPGNQFVFGGHGQMNRNGQLHGFKWLLKDVERIFPQLKGVNWHFKWGGKIAVTDDRLPHLHEPTKGLLAGLGYCGRGVAMSHLMGDILADRVLGTAPEELILPTTKIEPIPFRNIQLFGEGAAVKGLQMLDRLEETLGA